MCWGGGMVGVNIKVYIYRLAAGIGSIFQAIQYMNVYLLLLKKYI